MTFWQKGKLSEAWWHQKNKADQKDAAFKTKMWDGFNHGDVGQRVGAVSWKSYARSAQADLDHAY
eukprot:CAMPEP_0117048768 /NCGR_PEP_ID=MMETSP0472-20121206/33716_1 /TAXON_ID=693140 ORGANISM="Tiarina fusus, Strain LIS" /NCGR_SAMPLE_ID=MMETSP0472 /ASSEMBLY_ACC=CAM_ASM_000603 /LENGTH=64 /DNA_ID=CAMNT_0004762003 /DNA_START=13 /DNA_END=207 /DNA_ORIENTATION=-